MKRIMSSKNTTIDTKLPFHPKFGYTLSSSPSARPTTALRLLPTDINLHCDKVSTRNFSERYMACDGVMTYCHRVYFWHRVDGV